MTTRTGTMWLLGVAGWAAAGCGAGAAKEAAAPNSSRAVEAPRAPGGYEAIGSLEEAEAAFAHARAELGLAPRAAAKADTARPAAPAAEPSPPPPAQAGAPLAPDASAEERAAARCPGMCRALVSMRRAGEAICRMAGAADARCVEGRRALAEAERLCAGCGC